MYMNLFEKTMKMKNNSIREKEVLVMGERMGWSTEKVVGETVLENGF